MLIVTGACTCKGLLFAFFKVFLHDDWHLDCFIFYYLHPPLRRGDVGGTPALSVTGGVVF